VKPVADPTTPVVADPKPVAAPAPDPAKPVVADPAKPAAEPVKPAFELPDPELAEDAKKKIEEFRTAWPDVAAAFDLQRAHDQQVMSVQFTRMVYKVAQKIYADLAPVVESVATSEQNAFRAHVISKHSDFDAVKPQLGAWIEQQPPYLRDAYKRAHDEGSAEEVVDLVERFKKATGVTPQQQGSSPQPNTQPAVAEVKDPVDPNKAAALAPVQTKRTAPSTKGIDTNDFDGAFAEAAEAINAATAAAVKK
jgi:hypothetical protein